MKTFLKILAIVIIIVVAAMFVVPFLFHNEIAEQAKTEINESLDARVDFEDYNLSLFRNFPNFSFELEGLSIYGNNEFDSVKLAKMERFNIVINLMSVFKGGPYEVKKIILEKPDLNAVVLENESVNWNIIPESDEKSEMTKQDDEKGESGFKMSLRDFIINDAVISYKDLSTDVLFRINGLNLNLAGDFSASQADMKLKILVNSLNLKYNGIEYLSDNELEFVALFIANLEKEIYTFKNNKLRLNGLELQFDGSIAMIKDGYDLLLSFNTPENKFKNLLSLIPAIYSKDFNNIETDGKLQISGAIKGEYSENSMPAYSINIDVKDGMFHYPDFPASVNEVNISAMVDNKTGQNDDAVINVKYFKMNVGENPVDARMKITHPVSDPEIDGSITANFDLGTINDFYPLDSTEVLSGKINTNISLKGKLSSIENEAYDEFEAYGSLFIKQLNYQSADIPNGMLINTTQLNFAPSYLDLVNFRASFGKSDLSMTGKIQNYIPYILADKIIKGNFTLTSDYFDVNYFLTENTSAELQDTLEAGDELELTAIKVPDNIDFILNSEFKKLRYEEMIFENVMGKIIVKDEAVTLEELKMEAFGGGMTLNGSYATKKAGDPLIDFGLNISGFNISEAFTQIELFNHYAPFAAKLPGNFSGSLNINSGLDASMMPVYSSLSGDGRIKTSDVKLTNVDVLNTLSGDLGVKGLTNNDLKDVNISFDIKEGKLNVKPVTLNMGNIEGDLSGYTGFDQTIDYNLNLKIPVGSFGQGVNNSLSSLIEKSGYKAGDINFGDFAKIGVRLTGTVLKPKIKTALGDAGGNIIDNVKDKLNEEIEKKKEEVKKVVDDNKEKAKKILRDAQAKADKLRQESKAAAQKVKDEAYKRADQVIEEGKKKGKLAEIAAKKSAEEIKNSADKKYIQAIEKADKEAEEIMNKARKEAEEL